ncbi:MAG: hypothetical protein HC853_14615, partial [Anaerolineae bacterium]|nr:hypothetical protein [Anaerolineae bacterium]
MDELSADLFGTWGRTLGEVAYGCAKLRGAARPIWHEQLQDFARDLPRGKLPPST